MDWEELIAEFRNLGGVAENVRLGQGRFGRGIFAVDPAKPAKLHASENFLMPVEEIEVRDGHMVVKAEASVGRREREFFDVFHRHWGWEGGLCDELWQLQQAWSELPAEVVDAIRNMGGLEDPDIRLLAPNAGVCFEMYKRTRMFNYRGEYYLSPMIELVNHSSSAAGYVYDAGIGVAGIFDDEMLVRYNFVDAWKRVMRYSFVAPDVFAHSLSINVDLEGGRLGVERDFDRADIREGIVLPRARMDGNTLRLSFLTLGFSLNPDLPRGVFRKIASAHLNTARADEIFDNIAHFNRIKFIGLLRTLRKYDGTVVKMLQEAALSQLETLSCCIGARRLES